MTLHRCAVSSHTNSSTVVFSSNLSITPDSRATLRRYSWISGWKEYDRDQSFGAKEKE